MRAWTRMLCRCIGCLSCAAMPPSPNASDKPAQMCITANYSDPRSGRTLNETQYFTTGEGR